MSLPRPSAVHFPGLVALGCVLLVPALHAHAILSFDPNAKSEFPITRDTVMGAPAAPVVIQGMAEVRWRADDLEIDLTVADGAAYALLDHDPYQIPAAADRLPATPSLADQSSELPVIHDPHFEADQPLLSQRAESLFTVTSNGQKLTLLDASVRLTAAQDVVFHLTYPRPAPGLLHMEIMYFNQVPTGQKVLVSVVDPAQKTIAAATIGADAPYLEVNVPGPAAAAPAATAPPAGRQLNPLTLFIGCTFGVAVLYLGLKFLRRPSQS